MSDPAMRVAHPPAEPLLIFDGDCQFCRRWIARWQQHTGDKITYRPFQELADTEFPEIPRADFAEAVHFLETDGTVTRGAQAVCRSRGRGGLYEKLPGFAAVSEWAYRRVARNRALFSLLTQLLWGREVTEPSRAFTAEVFLRGLGLIYFIAFASWWTQMSGLIGSNGIAPVEQWLEHYRATGVRAFWQAPSVFWIAGSDPALHVACGVGVALAGCVLAGKFVPPALCGLWALYLSFMNVSSVFLGYQWDALLLETGFLAMGLAAWRRPEPPALVIWLLRWLAFRLMFCSGIVKLVSGDVAWNSLTALSYHYFTQPLPPWTAWYAQQLPAWFQRACCAVMFGIELILPFFLFLPRRPRIVAAAGFALLMFLISVTGNYCFFNLLTILLCVPLLDDRVFGRAGLPAATPRRWANWVGAPVAAMILLITIPALFQTCRLRMNWPGWIVRAHVFAAQLFWPLHSVNTYGLFAVMTTSRPEIILEGSADGATWRPYEFKYKPGALTRRPSFVWPHQPRLDWQMWFAALGHYQHNPWFINFCARLLEGKPAVTRLVAVNPFPDAPPKLIRALRYEYRFTDPATRRATGQWWTRELTGPYCPTLSLRAE
jgi:predicted DCC family thiol-disulfide oxidoreductase YuxK